MPPDNDWFNYLQQCSGHDAILGSLPNFRHWNERFPLSVDLQRNNDGGIAGGVSARGYFDKRLVIGLVKRFGFGSLSPDVPHGFWLASCLWGEWGETPSAKDARQFAFSFRHKKMAPAKVHMGIEILCGSVTTHPKNDLRGACG